MHLPRCSMADFTPGPWTLTHVAGTKSAVQEFEIREMFLAKLEQKEAYDG